MKWKLLSLSALILSLPVHGQIFKCAGTDGHTTYSSTPCPFGEGSSTAVSGSKDNLIIPEGSDSERINSVIEWAYRKYPFMNPESGVTNASAINDTLNMQDDAVREGADPAKALLEAVMIVGPRYESAEIIRRNTDATTIMRDTDENKYGTKITIVGGDSDSDTAKFKHYSGTQNGYNEYTIETAHNDNLFIINGEKYEAQTFCFGWSEGDKVIFLNGSPLGACTTAKLLNLRLRKDCMVWCE